jgi:excisionase family DNA binding protein
VQGRQQRSTDRYITVPEAADILSVSVRQVWRLLRADQIVGHKFGNCTRISLRELDQYFARSRRIPDKGAN